MSTIIEIQKQIESRGLLTVGTGPDHSLIDVYIGGSLWQSYDCWAPTAGERVIPIPVDGLLEIHNRAVRNPHATGTVMRFKQLEVLEIPYDERTIRYTYDALSRLIAADYDNGAEILTYGFDVAGNLTNLNGVSRTYNAANQLVHDGTNALTYDANGNMTGDGVNSYTWDRANRLLALGGVSYAYNGDGDRVAQTSGVNVTQYLLDLQPGLTLVLGDSDGNRYVHAPRGIHAVNDGAAWTHPLTDGLGSVRGYVDANNVVLSSVNYTPVGVPDTAWMGWAFTGEWRSENETQYHRARHLSPGLATWLSLDPFEGLLDRPLSLNGYSWVEGNLPNSVDASGMSIQLVSIFNSGLCAQSIPIPSTPTPSPPCNGYELDECDQIYLAHVSAAEASSGERLGERITSRAALAAIMLSQINRFRRGGQFYGISTGTRYLTSNIGPLESQRQYLESLIAAGEFSNINVSRISDINTNNQYRVHKRLCQDGALVVPNLPGFDIAREMAYSMRCTSSPLINFNFAAFRIYATERAELDKIARSIDFTEEKSFCTSVLDVLDDWQAPEGYGQRVPNLIPTGFPNSVAIFRGSGKRSVMVHDAFAFRNPHVNWQCDQTPNQLMVWLVTNNTSSPLAGRISCKRCTPGTITFNNGFVTACDGESIETCPTA